MSRIWAIFSEDLRLGSLTAAPAASSRVRYSAFPAEKCPATASSANPAPSRAVRVANAAPNLFPNRVRASRQPARTGLRPRRASGLRGVPSATASTSPSLADSGGSSRGDGASAVAARPQTRCCGLTSARLATYSVRPASRMWLGAGSPSAAATKDGAAMAESDSTAQSAKNIRIRSPSPVLKIATTRRRSGLSSWARSAA